jgi:DNA-binding MarR family transcriptional regulator
MTNEKSHKWTFLTNHAHIFLCLAKTPGILMKELADKTGITERAVQRIIAELAKEGYIEISRTGRRNTYIIHGEKHLKHPSESHRQVADLLHLIERKSPDNLPSIKDS